MSSVFDLEASIKRAEARLDKSPPPGRRRRSDRGKFRISSAVRVKLEQLLSGYDYPGIKAILGDLKDFCEEAGHRCPSRATVYKFMRRNPGPGYDAANLPRAAQDALYNLADDVEVPGAQLVFYCFNHGDLRASQFAAGQPWLHLYQAYRMRGWRPKSRGLLRAALIARGISHV